MANPEHVEIVKQGAAAIAAWRAKNPETRLDLHGTMLYRAKLSEADLSGAHLRKAYLFGADLSGVNLCGADLREANLSDGNLSGANLSMANLSMAHLCHAYLSMANLHGANLSKADLNEAILSMANVQGANLLMATLVRADLSEAELTDANLIGANLSGANLIKADLTGANLIGADLSGANLVEADVNGAKLNKANLCRAKLSGADLSGADLSGADLSRADLDNCCIENAKIGSTTLANVDLSQVKGLESVRHHSPSSIGVDTLYKSQGKIPDEFLRGCGVPEDFITYLPSLIGTMQPIQYQSCFISYSSKDEEFARRLHERMQGEKLRVWFAPEDMQGGKKIIEQIDRAIQVNDRLLLVLSEQSMKSEWVKTEIRRARKVELRDDRRKLFPIRLVSYPRLQKWQCLASDPDEDVAAEVRSYHIPDFSNWKDRDSFEAAFADLLRDLREQA